MRRCGPHYKGVCALDFPGIDIGTKINNALKRLRDNCTIWIPRGVYEITTPIAPPSSTAIYYNVNICGERHLVYPSFWRSGTGPTAPEVVLKSRIDSAPVLQFGNGANYPFYGLCLRDFIVEQKKRTEYPVIKLNYALRSVVERVGIYAYEYTTQVNLYAQSGIDIRGHGCQVKDAHIYGCDVGLVANLAHHLQIHAGKIFMCETGIKLGPTEYCAEVGVYGPDIEDCPTGIDVANVTGLSLHGGYFEGVYAERWPIAVRQGDICIIKLCTQATSRGVGIFGCRFHGGGGELGNLYGINLQRCRSVNIVGCETTDAFTWAVKNDGVEVAGVLLMGMYSQCTDQKYNQGGNLIDSATGVNLIIGCSGKSPSYPPRYDSIVLPNLPTSDPNISGALWKDTGNVVKVSAAT